MQTVIQGSTRGTLGYRIWFIPLFDRWQWRCYGDKDNGWTPLSRKPDWQAHNKVPLEKRIDQPLKRRQATSFVARGWETSHWRVTLIQYGEYVDPVQTMRFMLHGCVSGRVDYFLRSAEHYPPKKYEARLVVQCYSLVCSLGPLGGWPRPPLLSNKVDPGAQISAFGRREGHAKARHKYKLKSRYKLNNKIWLSMILGKLYVYKWPSGLSMELPARRCVFNARSILSFWKIYDSICRSPFFGFFCTWAWYSGLNRVFSSRLRVFESISGALKFLFAWILERTLRKTWVKRCFRSCTSLVDSACMIWWDKILSSHRLCQNTCSEPKSLPGSAYYRSFWALCFWWCVVLTIWRKYTKKKVWVYSGSFKTLT